MTVCVNKEASKEEHNLVFNLTDFVSYGGKTWSINLLSHTAKVCGHLFADFISLFPLAVACGATGSFLSQLGIIDSDSARSWDTDGLDLRVTNSWILGASHLCYNFVSRPTEYLRNFLWSYTPSIEYDDIKISKLFIATSLEDIVCIGFIQRTALPLLAKVLPERCGYILNHKVTRVVISSAIFALSHEEIAKISALGVMPQFIGGLVAGTVAELDDSLLVPILSHFAFDLMLGVGRSPRFS